MNEFLGLFLGFLLGILGSIIAAAISPPLFSSILKLVTRKSYDLIFSYKQHGNPNIEFGEGESHFVANWSPASSDVIHLYNQRPDTKVVGTIRNVTEFYMITDITRFFHQIEGGTTISQGQFFILKNPFEKYAIVQMYNYQPGPIGGEGNMHIKYKFIQPFAR